MSDVSSKNLRGATELMVIADLKPGFVPASRTITYASRLRKALGALHTLRKRSTEQDFPGQLPDGPLEKLHTLRAFQWTVFDDDKRLLIMVSFDGAWEAYMRALVDLAGPLVDLLLCHCQGYEGHSTRDGYQPFAAWIRARQRNVDLYYAAESDLTSDDVRYLKDLERQYTTSPEAAFASHAFNVKVRPVPTAPNPAACRALLGALLPLREDFALDPPALLFLDRTARTLTRDLDPDRPARDDAPGGFPLTVEKWADHLPSLDVPPPPAPYQPPRLDSATLQGNILEGYQGMTHGCLVFVQLAAPEGARLLQPKSLTTRAAPPAPGALHRNLALTHRGLRSLGCTEQQLAQFPTEFRDGLAARGSLLGMLGPNHPERWPGPPGNWPAPTLDQARQDEALDRPRQPIRLDTIDAVVMLQQALPALDAADDHLWSSEHPLHDEVLAMSRVPGVRILGVQPMRRWPHGQEFPAEHFGFADGISQPVPVVDGGSGSPAAWPGDRVALGELLLGHPDDRGETSRFPLCPELFQDGSFLVITKMEQDVAGFDDYLSKAPAAGLDERTFAAKLVGRHRDGTPLGAARPGPGNDFDYRHDEVGAVCPLHAHVRRANPRESHRLASGQTVGDPRIMRRGFSFGPRRDTPSSHRRGLVFMAYNASLAGQYEVIQRWVNGGNSTAGFSNHPDVLAGLTPIVPGGRQLSFVHDGKLHRVPAPGKLLCKMHWGLYLFTPSLPALAALMRQAGVNPRPAGGRS